MFFQKEYISLGLISLFISTSILAAPTTDSGSLSRELAKAPFNQPKPIIPNSGTLEKELSQQPFQIKPIGEIFNSPLQFSNSSSDVSISFTISAIQLIDEQGEVINDDVSSITEMYVYKKINLQDLNNLTAQLTAYYRANNYLVAKAIIPPQQIDNGILKIQILKGKIGNIMIENHTPLKQKWVERIIQTSLADSTFLYQDRLETLALLLNDIQSIKPALALKAGKQLGKTDLILLLEKNKTYSANIVVDNQGNKDTGAYRLSLGGKVYNILGNADDLSLNVISSNNGNLLANKIEYSSLIDGYGTRVGLTSSYLSYRLGGNFKDLNAKGHSHNLGVYIEHSTIRTPHFRLNTKLGLNHQQLKDQQNTVNLYQKRRINSINIGLNGSWNSITNGISYFSAQAVFANQHNQSNEAMQYLDSNFKLKQNASLFNYSFAHEQYLPYSLALNLSLTGQLSDQNLDSSQKMLLGGLYAVRGYTAGVASVDEGHVLQMELKHFLPIGENHLFTTSVYYDYGLGKYYKHSDFLADGVENIAKLQSVGLGLTLTAPSDYLLNLIFSQPVGKKLANTDNHQFWFSAIKTF